MSKESRLFGRMFLLKRDEPERYAKLAVDFHEQSTAFLRREYPEFFTNGRQTLPTSFYREFGTRKYKNTWGSINDRNWKDAELKVIRKYGPEGMIGDTGKYRPKKTERPANYYDDPSFEKVDFYKPIKTPL